MEIALKRFLFAEGSSWITELLKSILWPVEVLNDLQERSFCES